MMCLHVLSMATLKEEVESFTTLAAEIGERV